MKKILLVSVCALFLLVLTGCGSSKNQVTCTGSSEENGIKMTAELVADFDKNDKLSGATVVYDLNDSTVASQYCSFFKLMEDADKGITVECSGTKITIKGYAEMLVDDETGEKVDLTKDEFIKKMEESTEEKFSCKK